MPPDYHVFGLRIRSEIPLPELFPAEGVGDPDITIRRGAIEASSSETYFDGCAMFLTIPGVARYRVESGEEIVVDPEPGVPDRNVRLFLLGSALGALLHQRGLLPLHANAVRIEGKAVAFMGASGNGKSTLAAWFHQQAYDVIADDVCVVQCGDDSLPYATPGLPRLRLWADALQFIGRETADFHRSYAGSVEQVDKFDFPLAPEAATRSSVELRALYLLERGNQFSITELEGVEAAESVFANTYRGSYVSMVKRQKDHWQSAARLVQTVPVYRVVREWGLTKLDEQCRRLLAHAAEAVARDRHELS